MRALILCLLVSYGASAGGSKSPKDPHQVATKAVNSLQKSWDKTKTFSAQFKQVVFAKRLGTREESSGKVLIDKPSKLRWESEAEGTQILNKKALTVITENKRRGTRTVDIYPNAAKAVDSLIFRFLSGETKFKKIYNYKYLGENSRTVTLKFTPKKDRKETLVAEFDKERYLLQTLTSETPDSRVRIEFRGIQTNEKLDDKLFEYQKKKDDIVHRQ